MMMLYGRCGMFYITSSPHSQKGLTLGVKGVLEVGNDRD